MAISRLKSGTALALAVTATLGLAACSDPRASAASAPSSSAGSSAAKTFNLSPEQNRFPVQVSPEAAAQVPQSVKTDGKLTVAVSPFAAPLAVYAADNKTPVGNEVDIAVALADPLGLKADIVPTAWADWPLGVESGKYEAVISNVTVTEERKLKFDFASYREEPVEFQYYDDDSASTLALQSGRADLTFGPNATASYKSQTDGKTKNVGLVDGGWPLKANIAVTTKKGNGFAAAAQAGLNSLIKDGTYGKILDRWGLSAEGIQKSELNPPGLPKS
ncbi:transporter substrate-binding domain-containing protein [Arthrobacter sp. MMS18-M83]|uniref:transporter substrate-binding domain-containing protein n=1 Tax=Arthrobacter sp. MMS18-M83 TaxID=2996261 RepID=UPI00227CFD9C|nr:transporter substrate-binding domain-containing protein [Arthrobacter sp. MMS18-M83]WAH95437.1 transporter substrate-binding domain-containing protein [Arthrobacter sp. MMS18-M83]